MQDQINGILTLTINGAPVVVDVTVTLKTPIVPVPMPVVISPPTPIVQAVTHLVKATREGLVGQKTATGWVIDTVTPFVALPSTLALQKIVKVTNPLNGKSIVAKVLDVGPWNAHDDTYVFDDVRPQAESGTDTRGRKTNGAGIDLGEAVWNHLEMKDNSKVDWMFV